MKQIFIFFVIFLCATVSNAQVTIGSNKPPHAGALLDLKENADGSSTKGLLLPRVALEATNSPAPLAAHEEGMTVYNTATSAPSVSSAYYVSPGLYYNDGTKWERLHFGKTNWFYMPSVPIETSTTGNGKNLNLYNIYKNQFDGTNSNFVKSTSAPASVPYMATASDLYYYVTDYDNTVFTINSISDTGVMNYDVKATPSTRTYINIVFVLK
ncbi:hypothetical protein [Dysgonomonas sp.]